MTPPPFRPVHVMAEISRTFERSRTTLTVGALRVLHAPIKRAVIDDAVDALLAEGHLAEIARPGRRHPSLRFVKPFPERTPDRRPPTATRLVDVIHAESSDLIGAYLGARISRDDTEAARLRDEIAKARRHLEAVLELLPPTPPEEAPRASA